jgi:hypothetical protein
MGARVLRSGEYRMAAERYLAGVASAAKLITES